MLLVLLVLFLFVLFVLVLLVLLDSFIFICSEDNDVLVNCFDIMLSTFGFSYFESVHPFLSFFEFFIRNCCCSLILPNVFVLFTSRFNRFSDLIQRRFIRQTTTTENGTTFSCTIAAMTKLGGEAGTGPLRHCPWDRMAEADLHSGGALNRDLTGAKQKLRFAIKTRF